MNKNRFAGISLFCVFILCLSFVFGCSAQLPNTAEGTRTSQTAIGGFEDKAAAPATSAGSSSGAQSNGSSALADRKVIFSASLSIESTDYDKSLTIMEKMIGDFGGYIQDSNVQTSASAQSSSKLRRATYVIRIPVEKLKSFLDKAGDIGNVVLNTSKGEDVTANFYDTKAHLDALTIQEDRLLALLKTATVLKDILDLEDRLTQVRYQIEQLTGSLNKLTSLIDLSTVTININEVETITTSKPTGFWAQVANTFTISIQALVSTLRTLSLILVAVFPFLLVFGLIALAIWLICRRATRKKRRVAQAHSSAPDPNQPEQPK